MDYIISTPCGQLQGCAGKNPGTVSYKGIRYATAGRLEYPVQVRSWEGIYDATHYWFGTLENCWRPMEEKDFDLSRQMIGYLTNFCKYGDPNGHGLAAWLPTSKKQGKVLRLGEKDTHMGKVSMVKLVKTFLTNKAVRE